jgi:uncharacterized SAM-binding protein YcdF (DUF218 family)
MFVLSKLFTQLLLPPGLFCVLFLVIGVLALVRRARFIAGVAFASALLLYAVSLDSMAEVLLRPLEDAYPANPTIEVGPAEAIVLLGGGLYDHAPAGSQVAPDALKRALRAYRLHRRTGLPVVTTGGRVLRAQDGISEAEAAKAFLVELGIDPALVIPEMTSRTTLENARNVAEEHAFRRVHLVTSAYHMPRSVYVFREAGITPIPAPTDYKTDRGGLLFYDFLPSMKGFERCYTALHEYIGYLFYRLAG